MKKKRAGREMMLYEPYIYGLLPNQEFPFSLSVVDYTCRLHWHNHIEVLVGRAGECSVRIEDESFPLNEDTMVIAAPKEQHMTVDATEGASWYVLQIDPGLLQPGMLESVTGRYLQPFLNGEARLEHMIARQRNEGLFVIFHEIISVLASKRLAYEIELYAQVFRLFACLIEGKHILMSENNALIQNEANIIRPALDYIQTHYQERVTIDDMLALTYVCKAKFSQLFKNVTGTTFVDFLNQVRINEARALLLETEKSMSDIAIDVGFNSSSYFNKIFMRYCGMCPKEFRITQRLLMKMTPDMEYRGIYEITDE